MRIVDLNVLLYAVDTTAPHHESVGPYWTDLLNGDETVGLPWVVVSGFLRLTTSPRVSPRPFTAEAACRRVDEWFALDVVTVSLEKPGHWGVLRRLIGATGTAANLVTDAHIAAIALTHDASVVSCDRDFERFAGLRVDNPLRRTKR